MFCQRADVRQRQPPFPAQNHRAQVARLTSALTPALSPRRGRIVRRSFEILYDGIGRTLIRKTGNSRKRFPLLGERIKGEGGRKHSFHRKHRGSARRDVETNRNKPDRRPVLRGSFPLCSLRFLL